MLFIFVPSSNRVGIIEFLMRYSSICFSMEQFRVNESVEPLAQYEYKPSEHANYATCTDAQEASSNTLACTIDVSAVKSTLEHPCAASSHGSLCAASARGLVDLRAFDGTLLVLLSALVHHPIRLFVYSHLGCPKAILFALTQSKSQPR